LANKQIERKFEAAHEPCFRKSRARLQIPLICGVRLYKQMKSLDSKCLARSIGTAQYDCWPQQKARR